MNHIYAVIMAGGGGTRLWPISRMKHPKHLLPLIGERTLFQATLDRLYGFIPLDHVYVVTISGQAKELISQAADIPIENFLIEPLPRGTASVVGLAATVLSNRDPESIMIVLPSDHFIGDCQLFHSYIREAIRASRKNFLLTLGIIPTFPATGYGYIQRGAVLHEKSDFPIYRVLRFIEKPSEAKARKLLTKGDHFWNSGIFIWKSNRILREFSRQMPNLKQSLDRIGSAWGTNDQKKVLKTSWHLLKPETIDYGIMEHAENVAVLSATGLEWSDVGSWDSLFDVLKADLGGNIAVNCDLIPLETHNSLIYSSKKKLTVTIGIDDLVIIDSGDALLVCRRDHAQQVRQVISRLNKDHKEEYL
jgi:mannose-1-phosphate guanylyltransferase